MVLMRGVRWFVSNIPRGDTNGVGEDEVTVTSGLHAQKDKERWRLTEGQRNQERKERRAIHIRRRLRHRSGRRVCNRVMLLNHRGAPFEAEGVLCR